MVHYSEFTISTVSSLIAYGTTYPIDAIKTNFQVSNYKTHKPKVFDVVKDIYRTTGFTGYYKGVSSTLMTYPLFWGVFFQTQNYSNVMIASSVASFVTNPLFVLKTRFQTNINGSARSTYFSLTQNIFKTEGLGGFYKGFVSTLVNNTKLWIQFPLYDKLKSETDNIVFSSIMSKIISSTLYYPTDLIRTTQRYLKDDVNILQASKNIYKLNGLKGFYNGVILYNMISIPSFVALMVLREYIKETL
jgi:hypothetical protein